MKPSERRLSRPLYEALPWIYIVCGLLALVASYRHGSGRLSLVLGLLGLAGLLGGLVVLLRRRNFRHMAAEKYLNPDDSSLVRKLDE